MNTLTSHLAKATITAARPVPAAHLLAHVALGPSADPLTAVVLVLTILIAVSLFSTLRVMASLLNELLKVAAAVTSVLLTVVIVIAAAVAFLVRH
jgi:hypothetical protein